MDEFSEKRLEMLVSKHFQCDARIIGTALVQVQKRRFSKDTVLVYVFRVAHPSARVCYAWSECKDEFRAMLGVRPVDTPAEAIQMSQEIGDAAVYLA